MYVYNDLDLRNKFVDFIYKYRYLLALIIFLLAILFEIHGSSMGVWDYFLCGRTHQSLLGVVRPIRSDEFMILTPFSFSQFFSNFAYFSPIPRASLTDMFAVYGCPVWNILILFRPFQIGYLFLSQAKGLSFFWIGRLIALLLVSFELGMLITNNNKLLSFSYSILLTFSPIVQWWFSINYLVEMLIFGQLAILIINQYIHTQDYKKRLILSLIITFCVCGYIFALYPPWQIPLAYIFLFLSIWLIWDNFGRIKLGKYDVIFLLVSIFIIILSILYFFKLSGSTIEIVKNTVYPGSRQFYGGIGFDGLYRLTDYIVSPLLPLNYDPAITATTVSFTNLCEAAHIYDFFPVPLILYFIVNFIEKKNDKLLNLLFILYVFLAIFFIFGFPVILSKISLLSYTSEFRLDLALNILNLLILVRSLSLYDNLTNNVLLNINKNTNVLILTSIFISLFVFILSHYNGFAIFKFKFFIILAIFLVGLLSISIFIIFKSNNEKFKNYFLILCIFLVLTSGVLVNPIESGVSYYNQEPVQFAGGVVDKDPHASWIVTNVSGNIFTSIGAPTINSVNTYPDLNRWEQFDENHQFTNAYNKYAHIYIKLSKENKTTFDEVYGGKLNVTLNVEDLKILNVTYVVSNEDISYFSTNNVTFDEIYKNNKIRIYKLEYT